MFLAAARALADFVTPEQIEQGQLYPEAKDLRKVAATVGTSLNDICWNEVSSRDALASCSKAPGSDSMWTLCMMPVAVA